MANMGVIDEQARDAIVNRLWIHTVGLVNGVRKEGLDRITRRKADAEELGTGWAGRWGDHHFILTAGHVVVNAQPNDIP